MRREDIFLRDAARRGETGACLEMATRLFGGKAGFAQNFKLGLAYLQQELIRESPSAIVLLGEMVPLEILIAQDAKATLAAAARLGCEAAMLKLGVWQTLLAAEERGEGRQWLARSGHLHDCEAGDAEDARAFARVLDSRIPRRLLDAREVMLAGARQALRLADVEGAGRCLQGVAALTALPAADAVTAELVASFVELAATRTSGLDLPVELVESSLVFRSERADVQAQYVLGCALAGMPYGCLQPQALAGQKNLRRATALLLRAADAGQREAWHRLYEIAADCRSVAGNQEAARFFLEKAANAGVVAAQRKLGAFLLKEATSLEKAERGVYWLSRAAEGEDRAARELLKTLVLPFDARDRDLDRGEGPRDGHGAGGAADAGAGVSPHAAGGPQLQRAARHPRVGAAHSGHVHREPEGPAGSGRARVDEDGAAACRIVLQHGAHAGLGGLPKGPRAKAGVRGAGHPRGQVLRRRDRQVVVALRLRPALGRASRIAAQGDARRVLKCGSCHRNKNGPRPRLSLRSWP